MDKNLENAYNKAFSKMPFVLKYPTPFLSWFMIRYDLKAMFLEGVIYQVKEENKKLNKLRGK